MTETRVVDPATAEAMGTAMQLARGGDLAGARAAAERALAIGHDRPAAHALLGMICCQARDMAAGIVHLRAALEAHPHDLVIITNLASALLETGEPEAALGICTEDAARRDPSLRLMRLRAYLLQVGDDYAAAAQAYAEIVAVAPDDFESWNNLGNARAATGDREGSLEALRHALKLQPDVAPVRMNLAAALIDTARTEEAIELLIACARDFPHDVKPLIDLAGLYGQSERDSDAQAALEEAIRRDPRDPELHLKLGTSCMLVWAAAEAEKAFRAAIALAPQNAEAHVLLGVLLEHDNRAGELPALIADAEARGVEEGSVAFLRAMQLRREGLFAEALTAIRAVSPDVEPIRTAHLIGQCHDRLGDPAAAFAAFTEMNRQLALDPSEPTRRGEQFREALRWQRGIVTPEWVAGWRPAAPLDERPSPVFLVGFPRSGTTLLDTILMGHPKVRVLEERPPLMLAERGLGNFERLADLDDHELTELRDRYFREAAEHVDLSPGALLVDKYPMHINKVPLIHRLFPDARFILALRHPCDVVLSCFITNFRLNNGMVSFLDLEHTATVYDLSLGFWEQCKGILPLRTHTIVYEQLVADGAAELRPLFDYLGLDWDDRVLDHRQTAAGRGVISHRELLQVHEPIYKRAAGRWQRYREQMAPVLPILAPWVERLGYSLD